MRTVLNSAFWGFFCLVLTSGYHRKDFIPNVNVHEEYLTLNVMSLQNVSDHGSPQFFFISFIIRELHCLLGRDNRAVSRCLRHGQEFRNFPSLKLAAIQGQTSRLRRHSLVSKNLIPFVPIASFMMITKFAGNVQILKQKLSISPKPAAVIRSLYRRLTL